MMETLNAGFTHSVKDVLWGNIPFTKELKDILEIDAVQKLARIKQNGPTYHIYPGSVHTRLNHSIGVYNLSREILLSLARKNESLPLTCRGMMSFLCAALLHDIGHFPYAHSLKELAIKDHEQIAAELILLDGGLNGAVGRTGADARMTAEIIDKDMPAGSRETEFYRNILSGTLDPDKLDYLSRDAYFSGVPYGTQNTGYIISSMDFRDWDLVLEEDAMVSVEHVLFSKYLMYRTIYWHKGTRSATAMIKKAVLSGLRDGVISYDDLYLKDDEEFSSLGRDGKYGPFSLIRDVEHNHLLEKRYETGLGTGSELERISLDIRTREKAEKAVFERLKDEYPALEEYQVVIDIPEPVNFETSIKILHHDGRVGGIDGNTVFSNDVGRHFSSQLRKLSLFVPDYVTFASAEKAVAEADFAGNKEKLQGNNQR